MRHLSLRFYLLICLICACLLWMLSPALAQSAPWRLWLYDDAGTLVQVQADGQIIMALMPPPLPDTVYTSGLRLNANGDRVAYMVSDTSGTRARVVVLDLITGDFLLDYLIPDAIPADAGELWLNNMLFNSSDTALALAYPLARSGWEIVVLELGSGNLIFRTGPDTPAALAQIGPDAASRLPILQTYNNAEVDFSLISRQPAEGEILSSFRWNALTGAINPNGAFPHWAPSILRGTGEAISPVYDDRFEGPPTQRNSVHVYDPQQLTRFPVYTSPGVDIDAAYFVEGGRRMLLRQRMNAQQAWQYVLVARGGDIAANPAIDPLAADAVLGTPDGFVYTQLDSSGHSLLIQVLGAGQIQAAPLWRSSEAALYRPVWQGPPAADAALALGPWIQLGAPVNSAPVFAPADLGSEAFVAPGGAGVLRVGGIATINTSGGDRLNMRSGPGIAFSRVARLGQGTRVTLMEGPVAGDGLAWWRIRIADGTEGWVVQSADGLDTLLPGSP